MVKFNKKAFFPNLCLYVFIFLLGGLSFDNLDYAMYKLEYDIPGNNTKMEEAYSRLMDFFRNMGFSYPMFIAFFTLLILFIWWKVIRHYSYTHYSILVRFLITLFPVLVCQFRSFITFSILYVGLIYFIDESEKDWKFYLLLLLSCFFHNSMIFFFCFIIAKRIKPKKIFLFSIVFFLTMLLFLRYPPLIESVAGIFGQHMAAKLIFYLLSKGSPSFFGFLADFLNYLVWLFVLVVIEYEHYITLVIENNKKHKKSLHDFIVYCNNDSSRTGILLRCYLFVSFVLPFITINTVFNRFFLFLQPFICVICYSEYKTQTRVIAKKNLIDILNIATLYGVFYSAYAYRFYDRLLIPMFTKNYLWFWNYL